jgi:hypothetical protein
MLRWLNRGAPLVGRREKVEKGSLAVADASFALIDGRQTTSACRA